MIVQRNSTKSVKLFSNRERYFLKPIVVGTEEGGNALALLGRLR